MSLCKQCFCGVRHDGAPEGKWEVYGGVRCYVATPTVDYPKNKVVLYLSDVFGPGLINAQLLTDDFARNGFRTIAPDYFNGDPIPEGTLLHPGDPSATLEFDVMKWFGNHGQAQTRPILDSLINALKEEGVTEFAAAGYCFGARYVFDLAYDDVIKVAATSHPSLLHIPADLEKYASIAKAPLLINSCIDPQFPLEAQAKADEILGNGKFAPGYVREFFEGCSHGFAVRGDLSDPKVKAGKERAFKYTVEWFLKHL